MSERMTSIDIPGSKNSGIADFGRLTAENMIRQFREYAQRQKEAAEEILAAADDDFRVETYTGVYVQRNREVIQPGKQAQAILAKQKETA